MGVEEPFQRILFTNLRETLATSVPGDYTFEIKLYPAGTADWNISFMGVTPEDTVHYKVIPEGKDIWDILNVINEVYQWYPPSRQMTVRDHFLFGSPVILVVHKFDTPSGPVMRVEGLRT